MNKIKKVWMVVCVVFMAACTSNGPKEKVEKEVVVTPPEDEIVEVSFSAVGDNLIHGAIYSYTSNYDDVYQFTNYLTQDVDISYLNQETICAGSELELSSYPTFNGPYEVLDGVHSAGFNWISGSSNHSFDRGEQGIINEINYMKKYPDTIVSGIHESQAEADRIQVIEKKGLKIGVNSYTYGLNGFVLPSGKEYLVNLIDKDKIANDIEAMKKVSDIQVISMHWGVEYQFEANSEQQELAQYLSDLGVDVIIGTHPHVIEPMEYVRGKDGNQTLVIYSLGNFLSAQDQNYQMLGGNARWSIKYNKTKEEFTFEDVSFWPTVTYIGNNFQTYRTYALKDYTDELAKTHTLAAQGQDVSRAYFIELAQSVMGDKIKLVY